MAEKVVKETNANLANRDTIQPYIGSFQDVVDQGYMPPIQTVDYPLWCDHCGDHLETDPIEMDQWIENIQKVIV